MSNSAQDPRPAWARVKTPADLGRFLRRRRLELHLSQEEVATRLGFHRNYLQEIEGGKDILAYRRLFDLARELGVEIRVQSRSSETLGPWSLPRVVDTRASTSGASDD